jgi:cystathionine beta-lyase/cystathionine gamma-synthase
MTVTDLKAVSEIAHANGAKVVCDNTFMSPYLQQPINFGVDIVVHSTTKYLPSALLVGSKIIINDNV